MLILYGHHFGLRVPPLPGFEGLFRGPRKSAGQKSGVRTDTLEMVLDHDSGSMEGRCLKGRFAGRELSSLRDAEVLKLLEEIGASDKLLVRIGNKVDLLSRQERESLEGRGDLVLISARTGEGVPELLATIDQRLTLDPIEHVVLCFTPREGKQMSAVYERGRVLHREDSDGRVTLEAEIPRSLANHLRAHLAG